ncbi:Laccase [Rhynchospora pubera]|uniref:laccase n=1 Tax=Rhynchospora pubera TaxID=906938 RepID=A0AAV8DFZ9_9POAL|nr:Laccase [Rhynchospora pubera]
MISCNEHNARSNVTDQEGTLWWHAHVSYLRATVHGALIIRPRHGVKAYPFTRPDKEETIILGEWWNANVLDVEPEALNSGGAANTSDAYTINGKPDLYNCSEDRTDTQLEVESGKVYLLQIINAALNTEFFFKTVDALLRADADPGRYYLAASPYESTLGLPFANITTRGIVEYVSNVSASSYSDSLPVMPVMPVANDSDTTYRFYTNITGLVRSNSPAVPLQVDEDMLVAYGLGLTPCRPSQTKCNATIGSIAASMNNVSFLFPTKTSLLEAFYKSEPDVYTEDFPEKPPTTFDFTNASAITNIFTAKGTQVKKVKYNSTVQVVLQNTAVIRTEHCKVLAGKIEGWVLYGSTFKSYEVWTPSMQDYMKHLMAVEGGMSQVLQLPGRIEDMQDEVADWTAKTDEGLMLEENQVEVAI